MEKILREYLEKDEVIVKFLSNNMVQIITENSTCKKIKNITYSEFVGSMLSASEGNDFAEPVFSPVLPVTKNIGTVQHKFLASGAEIVILVREAGQFDINYFKDVYKNCGIPKLLFGIKIYKNVIQYACVVAVKDYIVSEESKIFCYPFSNAGSFGGHICFGSGNKISQIDVQSIVMIHSMPDMFLSMENNNDGYGQNLSGLEYRPLLESLVDKPFNNDFLKPLKSGYIEFNFKIWSDDLK